jgi:hypothetical protein
MPVKKKPAAKSVSKTQATKCLKVVQKYAIQETKKGTKKASKVASKYAKKGASKISSWLKKK